MSLILKLNVTKQKIFHDDHAGWDEVEESEKDYCFQIPDSWLAEGELKKEKIDELLKFIYEHHYRWNKSALNPAWDKPRLNPAFKIVGHKQQIVSDREFLDSSESYLFVVNESGKIEKKIIWGEERQLP